MQETIIVHKKTFETIKSAADKLVDFVKPTFGPASKKVIIAKQIYNMIVDDGVQIARDFSLNDPVENAIVKVIKETAIKTNDRVGDGTTGALIMLQAIINEVSKSEFNGRKVEEELKRGLVEVTEHLKKSAVEIKTKEDLRKVAMIAFDNEKIAEMIAELYFKLGEDGVITIDKSPTMDTFVETTNGIKIDGGYLSPYMVTNPERMETIIEKPHMLITDMKISEPTDLLPLMEKMAKANKRELVIIADNVTGNALATAIVNRIQNKFLIVAISAPFDTISRKIVLEDIALMSGAKMFSESKGDKLEDAEIADLGRAGQFICKQNESVIVSPKGKKTDIKKTIDELKEYIKTTTDEKAKEEHSKRLARFTNSIAVIKVGAPTDNEQKALKYKVEDTVNSTKSAFNHGVVCGAGVSLAQIKTSSPILNKALKAPSLQLLENMGATVEYKLHPVLPSYKNEEAYNLVTKETGHFLKVGVVDPVEVLIAGVESAVSIASVLLTSSGIIVDHEVPDKK